MNDRRKAIVGKFRASAIERVRKLTQWLGQLEREGALPGDRLRDLKRDLHTLKGESTMLGFGPMSEVFHAAEARLDRALSGGPEVQRQGAQVIALGCQVVLRSLEAPEMDVASLESAKDALLSTAAAPAPVAAPTPSSANAPEKAPATAAAGPAEKQDRWVQVQARRIDELCERTSDFEAGYRALVYRIRELVEGRRGVEAGVRALLPDLDRARASLEEITGAAWALRLVALEPALGDLVAHANEIAISQGKELRVTVRAGDAQIERTVLDVMWEPLVHLVRNAVDHGIEPSAERAHKGTAALTLEAATLGANIQLSIIDDGRGIDVERLRASAVRRGILTEAASERATDDELLDLIFLHGFSTRDAVSALSGRGVGLDVVRSRVESIGGGVRVSSELGVGTRFTLSIPATISKERALVFPVDGALYALPSRTVANVVRLTDAKVSRGEEGPELRLEEEDPVPLRSVAVALGSHPSILDRWVAIVEVAGHRFAFSMERPLGELLLLRRPVDRLLSSAGAVNGSAILEDGRIVLTLAAAGLVRQSERRATHEVAETPPAQPPRRILVVDDSAVVRDLMSQVLEHAGFDVDLASGGGEGISVFDSHRPDAVLLDIDMPDIDGFETLRRIRQRNGTVPVIMLTMRVSRADKDKASLLGASAYFVKSQFEETTILDTLRRFLGGTP